TATAATTWCCAAAPASSWTRGSTGRTPRPSAWASTAGPRTTSSYPGTASSARPPRMALQSRHSMRNLRQRATLACLVVLAPAAVAAQQPSGQPPPPGGGGERGPEVHELLPDIGRIGAHAGVMVGASWNPYDVGQGIQAAGYIDLPLARAPAGKLSYEIVISLSHADSDPFTITNPLAYVANLAT